MTAQPDPPLGGPAATIDSHFAGGAGARPEARSQLRLAMRAMLRDRLAMAGILVILFVSLVAIFAPVLSPWGPTDADYDADRLAPVGTPGHLLGTDGQARDVLSRLIWGARVSLPTAVVPVIVSATCGLVLGLVAGMSRRGIAEGIMRTQDVLFAFPSVLLAIAMATVLGPGMMNVMLAMSIVIIPFITRVIYVETL
jgi:ABC-type dipeptide/oligopeptide/nickel transport system permease subunit